MSTPSTSGDRDFSGLATLGDRLADWLDQLGLTDHLAEAGLPTVQRNCSGKAVWRDPATGEDLTEQQLLELDVLLHQEGEEAKHAVPIPLLQLARKAKVRRALLESAQHSYESLSSLRGASAEATRFWVHKSAGQNELLIVATPDGEGERTVIPAFQFTPNGEVRPELAELLAILLAGSMDAWAVWGWLTMPVALLGGSVPEELARDADELPLVLHAARRLASRTS